MTLCLEVLLGPGKRLSSPVRIEEKFRLFAFCALHIVEAKIEVLLLPTDCSVMVLCSFILHYLWIPERFIDSTFYSAQVITAGHYCPKTCGACKRHDVMTECKQYVWGA